MTLNIPKSCEITLGNFELTKEEEKFTTKIRRLVKIGVIDILKGNENQVKKWIKIQKDGEIISYTHCFYEKIERYALMYKATIDKVSQGKTKKEQKAILKTALHLIQAFGDNLNPKLLQELLEEESHKIERITKKAISAYDDFKDDERLQNIFKKANFFALKEVGGDFSIIDEKITKYIETSFEKEFAGIADIFNMFFYSSSKVGLNTKSLKQFADDLSRFFLEVKYLHQEEIAFLDLKPEDIENSFLEKFISSLKLGQTELEFFKKLIKNKSLYENILSKSSAGFIREIQEARKLDFSKKQIKEIPDNLELSDITQEDFESASPAERLKWFVKKVLIIDENQHITSKHNIPDIQSDIFDDFVGFMGEFYTGYNFDKKSLELSIKKVIKAIESIKDKVTIQDLWIELGYELSILRAWVKFNIIQNNLPYDFDKYKSIFSSGNGTREMILEGFEFDEGDITVSPGAKHNSLGVNFQEKLEYNAKNTEKGHINLKDKQFIIEGINFFNIESLYLPEKKCCSCSERDYDFDNIIDFQKNRLEEINLLLQGKNDTDEKYKSILKEYKFIYASGNINFEKLWSLRNTLKYAIFISKKLKKFHDYSQGDYNLLKDINHDLSLNLGVAGIKSPYRSIEKAMIGYGGNAYNNTDIVRAKRVDATLQESIASMQNMVNKIKASHYNDDIIQVIVGDNTGNPNELSKKSSGYRDIKVHLRTKNGNTIEIQFICQEINEYKEKGIDIEEKFLPIYRESGGKLTKEQYRLFERTAKERNLKIPKGLQKMCPGNYDFQETLYSSETTVNSDFFYHIRRSHKDKKFADLFATIESLYYRKVWNTISGALNQSFLDNEKK